MSSHRLPGDLFNAPFETIDPGTGQPLHIDRWGQVIPLVVAASAAETNTLSAPHQAGLAALIFAQSVGAGGVRTITVASAVDQSGDTTLVFDHIDDWVKLTSVPVGAGVCEWRIVASEGVTGSGLSPATFDKISVNDADGATVNGGILPQVIDVNVVIMPHASQTKYTLFTADRAYKVTKISVTPSLVQGGALTGTLCKTTGTATPSKATTPFHTADAINLNATAHTVQPITLSATTADLAMAAGERIGLDLSAALSTGIAQATISLQPV